VDLAVRVDHRALWIVAGYHAVQRVRRARDAYIFLEADQTGVQQAVDPRVDQRLVLFLRLLDAVEAVIHNRPATRPA